MSGTPRALVPSGVLWSENVKSVELEHPKSEKEPARALRMGG